MAKKATPFSEMKELGQRLKRVRVSAKLTQKQVGEIMRVTDVSVGRWEDGKAEPPLGYLEYLAKEHAVSIDWLLLGKESAAAEIKPQGALGEKLSLEVAELSKENRELRKRLVEISGENPTAWDTGLVRSSSDKERSSND